MFIGSKKITIRVLLRSSPFINRDSASSTFLHGLSGRNMLNLVRHTNLCIHNSESYMFLELTLLSCIPTLVYQLIVRNSCAFTFIDAYFSCGSSSHSIPEWLGETNSRTNPHPGLGQSSCIPQIKCQSSLWFCSTLEYYPLYVRIVMRTTPTLMNFDVVILLTIISHSSASCWCNWNTDKWIVMCEIYTPSNLVA